MEHSLHSSVVLDSCVWIAFLHKEDSQHAKAVASMETLTEPVLVPEYVLLEVVTVLISKGYATQAKAFAERVMHDSSVFLPAGELAQETVALLCAQKGGTLSFVDTALVVLSESYKVVTFDRHLAKALDGRHE